MIDSLDDMQLPFTNPKDELEELSANKFIPLFDVGRFQVRPESFRDRGIDYTVEIKKNGKHTNFRFSIQLKATESVESNADGSYSLSLKTSNINYLLNDANEAYYVLYVKEKDCFFIQNLNDVYARLFNNDENWGAQKSHTIRFNIILNEYELNNIYDSVVTRGKALRAMNEVLANKTQALQTDDKVIVDSSLKVTNDNEIRSLIEKGGFYLVNEGRWKEVIEVHKRATGNVAKSAKYNMILGIAHFYNGAYYDSISFLRKALKLQDELEPDLISYLRYFEAQVKYGLGMLSSEDLDLTMNGLSKTDSVGLYVRLEKAKEEYAETLGSVGEPRIQKIRDEIEKIIGEADKDENIKLIARAELALIEGYDTNMNYVRRVAMLNAFEEQAGVNMRMRLVAAREIAEGSSRWLNLFKSVRKDAADQKNYFAYFLAVLNQVKVWHEMEVYMSQVQPTAAFGEDDFDVPLQDEELTKLNLDHLEEAERFYNQIGHKTNICAVLSTKYEIEKFYEMDERSTKTMERLEKIVEENDLVDERTKLIHLQNGGTTYEQFSAFVAEKLKKGEDSKKEAQTLTDEIRAFDEADLKSHEGLALDAAIHLFPLGYFRIPLKEKSKVFDILGVTNDAVKLRIDKMWNERAVPVVNIYRYPIESEGFGNGNLDIQGLPSLRNVHRIRKEFFESGYQLSSKN